MSKIKYTREMLVDIVKGSFSYMEVLRRLGLKEAGGSHYHISKKIKEYGINTSHFKRMAYNIGVVSKTAHTKESFIKERLKLGTKINGTSLRKFLIKFGIKEHRCEKCNNIEWNGELIPLEVDHIDGNHENNELSNLRFLCPNCHAQTETYCSKNKKNYNTNDKNNKSTCSCGNHKSPESDLCVKCSNKKERTRKTKIDWPDKEEILERLKTSNFSKLGRELGVSDNAIRKHLAS